MQILIWTSRTVWRPQYPPIITLILPALKSQHAADIFDGAVVGALGSSWVSRSFWCCGTGHALSDMPNVFRTFGCLPLPWIAPEASSLAQPQLKCLKCFGEDSWQGFFSVELSVSLIVFFHSVVFGVCQCEHSSLEQHSWCPMIDRWK